MSYLETAASQILEARESAFQEIMATPAWRSLARFDAAYRDLTGGEDPPSLWVQPESPGDVDAADDSAGVAEGPDRRSVATALLELLEAGDASWSVNAVLAEFDARQWGFDVADIGRSVRSAFWNLVSRGEAVKEDRGRYRAAKFVTETEVTTT